MSEKVGSDVLGQGGLPQSGLTEKKRKEILKKLKDEKKRKAIDNVTDIEGKEVHGDIPNDQHDKKLGEHGYDEKDVNVSEHKRGRPKKNQSKAEKLPKSFWEQ